MPEPRFWFTADTHFGHANVIKHANRPFATVEEMDAKLIANWNAIVAPSDWVFHMGDFAWKDAGKYLEQLHGSVCLCVGNHDQAAHKIKTKFMWMRDVYMFKLVKDAPKIWLSHYSHEVWPLMHHGAWHLYGHSHNSLPTRQTKRSMDVGVDAMAARLAGWDQGMVPRETHPDNYRPYSLEEIRGIMDHRTFVPVDHHDEECG